MRLALLVENEQPQIGFLHSIPHRANLRKEIFLAIVENVEQGILNNYGGK